MTRRAAREAQRRPARRSTFRSATARAARPTAIVHPKPHEPGRLPIAKQTVRRRAAAVFSLVSAALLFVTVSIPALAVNFGDERQLATAQRTDASVDGQKLEIDGDVIAAPRTSDDAYTTGFAQTSGSYAQTASTFVNYSGPVQWPFLTGVPISTDFGPRVAPCGGCSTYHKGIDMNPGNGSPIQAIAAGVVREVSNTDNEHRNALS